jgi:MFS family permease
MGALSIGISARIVMKYGYRKPLAAGLLAAAAGLALLARAPVDGHFLQDVLPSMILLGFGAGIAFNPVLLAAMGDVEPQEAGLASGLVNTSFMMGGALGLAVLASISSSRAAHLGGTNAGLTSGYHYAFVGGAICALLAATLGGALLRDTQRATAHERAPDAEAALDFE